MTLLALNVLTALLLAAVAPGIILESRPPEHLPAVLCRVHRAKLEPTTRALLSSIKLEVLPVALSALNFA